MHGTVGAEVKSVLELRISVLGLSDFGAGDVLSVTPGQRILSDVPQAVRLDLALHTPGMSS